ncbi:hypothetical protein LY78DRAFT_730119 [Colletotrichum sublineola]|nr:hypothetical protein LY78DRAFT_730119 [Colletotrichum sublineola]
MSAASLLWVPAASASASALASMIRSITCMMPKEIPGFNVQVLGLEAGGGPQPLWYVNPECEVLVDGEVRILRVMPASGLNERFSARDRSIVKPAIGARDAAVQAVANGNEKMELWSFIDHSSGIMRMKVEFALHIPSSCSKASSSPAYISHGRVGEDWTMEISSANVSRLDLQPEDVVSLGRLCATPASIEATAPNISSYG